jgi:hypothetical protein
MNTAELLPIAHLALSAVFLLWNILLAGRITQQRAVPPLLSGLTAVGGLLIAPAFLVLVASTSLITGRSVSTIGWIWPVTATLIAAQAFYATAARLVSPVIGIPILLYDLAAAGAALGGYLVVEGAITRGPLLTLVAASASAVATVAGSASAISPPPTWRCDRRSPAAAPTRSRRWCRRAACCGCRSRASRGSSPSRMPAAIATRSARRCRRACRRRCSSRSASRCSIS